MKLFSPGPRRSNLDLQRRALSFALARGDAALRTGCAKPLATSQQRTELQWGSGTPGGGCGNRCRGSGAGATKSSAPRALSSTRWRAGAAGSTLATVFESRASALAHAPRFYDRATADAMFDEISQYAGLNFTSYLIEGARVRSPRRMMWCAADGVGVPVLGEPRARVTRTPSRRRCAGSGETSKQAVGTPFNAVLINLYADGTEHAAWHSDDDPWLGKDLTSQVCR